MVLDLIFYNRKLNSAESGQEYRWQLHCFVQGIFNRSANRILETNVDQEALLSAAAALSCASPTQVPECGYQPAAADGDPKMPGTPSYTVIGGSALIIRGQLTPRIVRESPGSVVLRPSACFSCGAKLVPR